MLAGGHAGGIGLAPGLSRIARAAWSILPDMSAPLYITVGEQEAGQPPRTPVVLDSPHSGHHFPADFDSVLPESALREAEDCFIDTLYTPATALGIPLLAAGFPRTYLDVNRHVSDLDPELLDGPWPGELVPTSKATLGKALLWRTLDDGRPIYGRRLSVAEVLHRIDACHRPYHATLRRLLDAAQATHGVVVHWNCHSMNSVGGAMSSDAGRPRADIVLGDRDGTTCDPALTDWVRERFAALGYEVRVNDPFKGVELVRAYSAPGAGRHSLQVEINKRVYMDEVRREVLPHFAVLQSQITDMLRALVHSLGLGPGPLRLEAGFKPDTALAPPAASGAPDAR